MWARFSESILKNRVFFLVITLLVIAFMTYKSSQVQLSYAGSKVLPIDDPAFIKYNEFKNTFGEDGTLLVLGIQSDKLFKKDFFNDWYRLGNELRELDGITEALSIAHVFELKKDTAKKSFIIERVIKNDVSSQTELDSLQQKIEELPFYKGLIYNKDSNATLMALSFDREILNTSERNGIIRSIVEAAEKFSEKHDVDVRYSGLPYIRTLVSQKVAYEFQLFLGLALAITALVLLIFFRSFYAVMSAMLVVIAGVILSLGTLVLFNYEITLLTGLIPPLIVVIGIPNSILLLNKYHNEFLRHGDKIRALKSSIRRVGFTIFLTNLTTAIGFGVFAFTNSAILTQFGIVSAISVMSTWLLAIVLIPIIFSYLPDPKVRDTKHLENKYLTSLIEKIDVWVHNHRKHVYIATLGIVIIACIGISKIKVNGFIVDDLPQNDPVLVDLKFFERNFEGVLPLEIDIRTNKKNGLMNIPTIRKIEKMEEVISSYTEFSRSISVNEVLKFSKQAYYNGNPNFYALPNQSEAAFIMSYAKRSGGGGQLLKSYVDSNISRTRVSFQMADVGSNRMNILFDEIQPRLDSIFDSEKYDVSLTGSSVIFLKGNNYLLENLRDSLLMAVALISLLLILLLRNFKMVIISLIPNIIPLMITAAIMGYMDISLKPSTILIFSIALGIASDQTLYFLTRFRHEQRIRDWSVSKIVSGTLCETGVSMIYTAIILFFGFGIFAASTFGGTVSLGILLSITLVVAMIANITLLPALLLSMEKREKKRNNKKNIKL